MTLLVTGATGFVMSVLARHWLDAFPNERVAVLDAAAPDAAALRYFASVADRLDVVVADVTHPAAWQAALRETATASGDELTVGGEVFVT